MAQFNADILLAVRGSEKAKKEVEKLELAVDKLGKKLNLDIGGQIRLKGEQSLLKVRVKNFGILQKELKVSQQIAREASKLARVQGNPNQYGGPIGPGQASQTALSSSLAQKRNERIQERIRERARGLNQYSSGIFPKPDLNREIQKRSRLRSIARSTARIRDQGLSKSVFQTKLELQLATKLSGVEKLITAEQQKQISAQQSLAKQREKALDKASKQYRKPIGPELPQAKKKGGRGGGAGGGLAAGIGFPLLFGGGPGSVIGGAVGSVGGFGTQILASAIGGIIDQAVANIAKLGQALNPFAADIKAITAAAGKTGTAFERLLSEFEKVAGEEKALEVATAQLATVIGTEGVDALREFGDASTDLSNELSKALTALGAALAPLLTDITRATANAIERSRLVRKGANDLKDDPRIQKIKDDLSDRKIGEIEAEDRIAALVRELELEEQINIVKKAQAALQAKIDEKTASAIALKEQELIVAQNGVDVLNEQVQTALQNIDAEKIRLKILEAQGDTLKLNLAYAEGQLLAALRANKIAAAEEAAARKAEAATRKAANEEKRLTREAEQARKKELRVQQTLAQLDVQKYDTAIQLMAATEGQQAALEEQKRNLDLLLQKRIEILELSDKDARIQEKEKELLIEKNKLELATINNKLQEIVLQEKLNKLAAKQQVEGVQTKLDQELSGLSLGGNEQTDLLEEQANRYANTLRDVNNEIEKQKLLLADIPTPDKKATDAALIQLNTLEQTKSAYEAMLPQIFAAEQAQLRYNQAFAAISPAVNSLVGGLQEVVAGTKTAEEAFADFLKTVADQLISTAATMIAQYIAIAIAKRLAGLGSDSFNLSDGGSSVGSGGLPGISSLGGLFNGSMPFMGSGIELAEGGYVTGPTQAVVGEGGQPEYVIPASKMDGAMSRWNSGARGADVIDGGVNSSNPEGSGSYSSGPTNVIVNGGITQMGGTDYIRKDEIPSIVAQASKQGEARTLRRLQMSPGTRRKLGM